MDALTRILAPEIEKRVSNSIRNNNMEIVGRMIQRGLDNDTIYFTTNIPKSEIEAMRSTMTV